MGKRCECSGVVEMLERDPRLRALPLAPRMLWFALVRAMQAAGVAVLRFGSVVPEPREVALMVGIAETELEANLHTILDRGLLVRDADGALASPLLRAAIQRSETNRANGLKGGRPPKARAGQATAQREMILPIAGGRDVEATAAETELEANPGAASLPAKLKPEEPIAKQAVDDAEFHRVGRAAMDAAGFDQARSMVTYGIVRQWLADGVSGETILDVIDAKMARGCKPGHLGYFTRAIVEAAARAPAAPSKSVRDAAFFRDVKAWQMCKIGPMPDLALYQPDGSVRAAAA